MSEADTAWITKEQAAVCLDRSVRTVLAMAADGRVKSRIERDPLRRGQKTTLFDLADVQRAKAGDASPLPKVRKSGVKVKNATLPAIADAAIAPAPPSRPWLTLDEACAYSGLTKRWLLEQASEYAQASADGMLDEYWCGHNPIGIRDMGAGGARGGRWRFHRESLERA